MPQVLHAIGTCQNNSDCSFMKQRSAFPKLPAELPPGCMPLPCRIVRMVSVR